jgi:hypothetical protein
MVLLIFARLALGVEKSEIDEPRRTMAFEDFTGTRCSVLACFFQRSTEARRMYLGAIDSSA